MSDKIKQLQFQLKQNKVFALFVTNQANVTYLTGFSGLSANEREAFLLITPKRATLLTFPTYFDLYRETKGIDVVCLTTQKGLDNWLFLLLTKEKIKVIGVEEESLTLAEFNSLKRKLPVFSFKPVKGIVEEMRIIKAKEEISAIRKACRVNDLAFKYILTKVKKNISEKELTLALEFFLRSNADDLAFNSIVAFNEGAAIPHYLPSKEKKLEENSLILLDFGSKVNNYCSDITRVIFFGKPDQKFIKVYQAVTKAQELVIKYLQQAKKKKTIFTASLLDKMAKDYILQQGFTPYPHVLGHGVGVEIHERPKLRLGSLDKLTQNMVFTLEPAIYLPGWGGVRIEDLVLLGKDGVEILTQASKSLITI